MSQLLRPGTMEDPVVAGYQIFAYVRDHSELCRVLLGSKSKAHLIQLFQTTSQDIPRIATPNHIPPEIAEHHFMSAALELIHWWLDHDMPYPPEQMGQIFATLILLPSQAPSGPC